MKNLFLVILIFLLSTPIWSENLTIDDLVERDNLFYKKFTNIPFSGEISGRENGKFKNGRRYGEWTYYHFNGQLKEVGNYKYTGRYYGKDGLWIEYDEEGKLLVKKMYKDGELNGIFEVYYSTGRLGLRGQFKDINGYGTQDGLWVHFHPNGKLQSRIYHNADDSGKYDGIFEWYYENGNLKTKGNYKSSRKIGIWEYFDKDGSLKRTETWDNGVMIKSKP